MKLEIYLALLFFGCSKCENLNYEENIERLESCGKKFLEDPKRKVEEIAHRQSDWIVKVRTRTSKEEVLPAAGSFISSRHVLTSAQSVITGERKYGFNGEDAQNQCSNSKEPLEVPKEIVAQIEIVRGSCDSGLPCDQTVGAEKAFVLDFCDSDAHFDRMFRIMIVEVQNFTTTNFACISNETTIVNAQDLIDTYGFDGHRLMYRLSEISKITDGYLLTSKYYVEGDRGGPMVKRVDGKATIVGVGASPGYKDNSSQTMFFDLSKHFEQICNVTGICVPGRESSTTSTMTTTSEIIRMPTKLSSPSTYSTRIQTSTEKTISTTTSCQFEHESEDFGETKDEEEVQSENINSSENGTYIYLLAFFIMFYLSEY